MVCDCLPSCDETEITVIKDVVTVKKTRSKKKVMNVELILAYLPAERFKRNVVRSRLDLVVRLVNNIIIDRRKLNKNQS
ncbi:unnamed protein product [Leptidea sinapis]|uniref:Uncharacterized protein n=1 Tax=Leptidea sinapis TaxID=189913 RepID=A0A5E4PWE2_9NEOP|nr:unnamed protein product [Leptidea sinapis]